MNIKFKNGRTPAVHSVHIPKGQVYTHLTLGEPYGAPSEGYTARVYEGGAEVGSASNWMDGRGWSINVVGHAAIQERYQKEEQLKLEKAAIFDAMEAHFPQYTRWERFQSRGLLQSLVANVLTVNFEDGAIRAYWHKEDRWEVLQ